MAWIRIRSLILVFTLPLLSSGAADAPSPVQGANHAAAPDVASANRFYSAGPHERRFIRTLDGSTIWLNFGASVLVAFTTDTRSVIMLSGEALFTVKHDTQHPFRVISGRSVAEDVGTVFSVTKKPTSSAFLVAEGEIAVFDSTRLGFDTGKIPAYMELAEFRRGERVEISDESGARLNHSVLTDDAVSRAFAWKDGRVRFAETPLEDAVAEFNQYSQIKIQLAPDVQQRGLRASGSFALDDTDSFVSSMAHVWGLHAQPSKGPDGTPIILLTSEPDRKHSRR